MERFNFENGTGCYPGERKQELLEILSKAGYPLSEHPDSNYWKFCTGKSVTWGNGLGCFFSAYDYNVKNEISVDEMIRLATQHMKEEKYKFKYGEGCVVNTTKELYELHDLAVSCGYGSSITCYKRTDKMRTPTSYRLSRVGVLTDFDASSLIIRHSVNEMKELLKRHLVKKEVETKQTKEFPENWCIKGSDRLSKLFNGDYKFVAGDLKIHRSFSSKYSAEKSQNTYYVYKGQLNFTEKEAPSECVPVTIDQLEEFIKTRPYNGYGSLKSNQKSTTMQTAPIPEEVTIPAEVLREGYEAMTGNQKLQIVGKIDPFTGICKSSDLIKFYQGICPPWQEKLAKLFPFLKDTVKHVWITVPPDSSTSTDGSAYDTEKIICVRGNGPYANKAYILNSEFDWEVSRDPVNANYTLLIPKRK